MDLAVEWVILACSILLLGPYLAVVSLKLRRVGAPGLLEAARASACWSGLARDPEQSLIDAHVGRLVDKKRVEMVMVVSSVAQGLLFTTILWAAVNIVIGASRIRNATQDAILLTLFGSLLFADWNRSFGSRSINIMLVYSVAMILCTALVIFTTDSRFAMMLVNAYMVLPRCIFSLAYVKSGNVCLCCVLHTAALGLTYTYLLAEVQCTSALPLDDHTVETIKSQSPLIFVLSDAVCGAIIVFSALGMERTTIMHARQELEVTAKRGETTATRRLLNTICDATFELDASLRIVDDALQLACGLQHGCNRSLRGAQAEQLLVAEDRALFRERIAAPVLASQSMANVLHVRMRDSLNNLLKVELFHVPVAGSLTGASHLIGVREHADCGEWPLSQLPRGLGEALGASALGPQAPPTPARLGTPAAAVFGSPGGGSGPEPPAQAGQLGSARSPSGSVTSDVSTRYSAGTAVGHNQLSSASYLQLMMQGLPGSHSHGAGGGAGLAL